MKCSIFKFGNSKFYWKLEIGNWKLTLAVATFLADRFIKWYFQHLPDGSVFSFLPSVEFTYSLNPSLFFFPAWSWIPWAALGVLIAISIAFLNSKLQSPNYKEISNHKRQTTTRLGFRIWNLFGIWDLGFGISNRPLLLIFLGGLSNVFDRFAYGGVIDYVEILGLASINVADIMILGGLVGLILKTRVK